MDWVRRGNGSVTVGEDPRGVRPSSGAAITDHTDVPDFITSPSLWDIAGPEDGRTPLTSPPPSLTSYAKARVAGQHFALRIAGALLFSRSL